MFLFSAYLIRAPVPHGGDGHADEDAWPGQVRGQRVPEKVEGIVAGETTGRVGDPDGGDGVAVALQKRVPSPHLGKTWWKKRRRKRRRRGKSGSNNGWKSSQVDFISKLN